ncbi:DUF5665 domain-containing protein [Salipiger mucosus]|uniref:Uncharacterized protein n=1 Tax=Salipiger mucosus DSM 16094 TaxID=1123237 RepID=S9QIP5_9RHOB|nr:DUF5665 domain-containing protein [Salipiger mucosus]EPX79667.1 hypothetical protein Salmuc_05609 [Salipiger mucosus DSM 16094]
MTTQIRPTEAATPALSTEDRAAMTRLADALETLNAQKVLRINASKGRMMWFQFLRGAAFGLGSFLGASVGVSLLITLLAQVEFVPILGDFAGQIIQQIDTDTE